MDAYLSTIAAMKRGMSGVNHALLLFCGADWPGMDHFKTLLKVRDSDTYWINSIKIKYTHVHVYMY